jgi:hypothetical protein
MRDHWNTAFQRSAGIVAIVAGYYLLLTEYGLSTSMVLVALLAACTAYSVAVVETSGSWRIVGRDLLITNQNLFGGRTIAITGVDVRYVDWDVEQSDGEEKYVVAVTLQSHHRYCQEVETRADALLLHDRIVECLGAPAWDGPRTWH